MIRCHQNVSILLRRTQRNTFCFFLHRQSPSLSLLHWRKLRSEFPSYTKGKILIEWNWFETRNKKKIIDDNFDPGRCYYFPIFSISLSHTACAENARHFKIKIDSKQCNWLSDCWTLAAISWIIYLWIAAPLTFTYGRWFVFGRQCTWMHFCAASSEISNNVNWRLWEQLSAVVTF